jgi:methionyl-tRNA synthetase
VDDWWKNPDEVELFQFIGKDNIPFHTVIFPSSLLGSGDNWTMLHHMSSTEYLNYESGKFSKSKGIGVFGTDVMETGIPADVWRFYIFYNRPEKADALFTWKDFQEKVNGELIGNLGNLVNRTLSFVTRYYEGSIPEAGVTDPFFLETVRKYITTITEQLDRADERDAFRTIFELSSFANKCFQDAEPWRTRKDDPPKAAQLIHDLCYIVRDLGILIEPYMPQSSQRIASFFGLTMDKKSEKALDWNCLGQGTGLTKVVTSEVLFAKLEDELITELRDRYSGSQKERQEKAESESQKTDGEKGKEVKAKEVKKEVKAEEPQPVKSPEEIVADFPNTLDLRVAKIIKIEKHPKAEKLYIETLETGVGADGTPEERVIVSGLVPFYKEEELLGKHIIVAYNLKPAKLRGVESRGMLLAASDHNGKTADGEAGAERVEVLDAQGVPVGTRVLLEDSVSGTPPPEIDIDTFFSIPLIVDDSVVKAGGKALTLDGKPVKMNIIGCGEVH